MTMAEERVALEVLLTPQELFVGAISGIRRRIASLDRPERWPDENGDGWHRDIEGALGELAFAKAVGAYWSPTVNTFTSVPDVAGVEIRTASKDHYRLTIRPTDADDRAYVLVIGRAPRYRVVGWLLAGDAKREEWLEDHGAGRPRTYFVPQSALRPIDELVLGAET